MILDSKAGFLFRTTDAIKAEYPELPALETYDELLAAIKAAKSVMVPSSATTSSLQNNVGQPSFSMRGLANCSKVSEMRPEGRSAALQANCRCLSEPR